MSKVAPSAEKVAPNTEDFAAQFSHLTDDGLGGFEQMTADTIAIPFLRILQQLSPQLDDSKPEYIEGAKKGMFCNAGIGKVYAPPLEVVVGRFDRYFIEWKPNRGGFVAAHSPESINQDLMRGKLIRDEKNRIVCPDTKDIFMDTYVYFILLPQHLEDGLMLLSLSSTQLKEARKWNRNLMSMIIPGTNQRAKPYYMRWNLTTPTMQNEQGSWSGLRVDFAGWVTQEQFNLVCEERKALPPTITPNLAMLEGANEETEVHDVDYTSEAAF